MHFIQRRFQGWWRQPPVKIRGLQAIPWLVFPMFICLWINCWHPPVRLANPLQGGGKNFRLALLTICHPPDQNAETTPDFIAVTFLLFLHIWLKTKTLSFCKNLRNVTMNYKVTIIILYFLSSSNKTKGKDITKVQHLLLERKAFFWSTYYAIWLLWIIM